MTDEQTVQIWEQGIPALESALEENPADEKVLVELAETYERVMQQLDLRSQVTCAMRVMSFYRRRLDIESGSDFDKKHWCARHLSCAFIAGVYTDAELYARCKQLRDVDSKRPGAVMLHAASALRLGALEEAIDAADAALAAADAVVAEERELLRDWVPWRAHFTAACAAAKIAKGRPKAKMRGELFVDVARKHVELGVKAGGPIGIFRAIFGEKPRETQSV